MSSKKYTLGEISNVSLESLGDRLMYAINLMGYTQKKFADNAGVLPATLNGIIKSGKKPTSDTLKLIHEAGINIVWLVLGEGDIFVKRKQQPRITYKEAEDTGMEDMVQEPSHAAYDSTLDYLKALLKDPDNIPPQKQKALNNLIRSILDILS